MRDVLEQLLRATGTPDPERAERLWAEYRAGGPGADAAFATLLAWHGGAIYRRVWGFVRSDAADDVFQDVLAALHRERGRLDTFAHALRWLRATADSRCVDAHRRRVRRAAREMAHAASVGRSTVPDDGPELQEALRAELAKLPAAGREAVALVFFEGLTRKDAAAAAGVHRDTFAKLLDGALARLRGALAAVAVGGAATTVEAALTAHPPLAAARLAELVSKARAASMTGWLSLKLTAAVVVLTCGPAVGGWVLTRDRTPGGAPQPPVAAVREAEALRATLQDRNRRLFETLVRQKVERAIAKFAPGAGDEARIAKVDAHDTRLEVLVVVTRGGVPDRPIRLKVVYDALDGSHRVYVDLLGTGRFKSINPEHPLYTFVGARMVAIRFEGLDDLLAAFREVNWADPRMGVEHEARLEVFRRAAEPYLGTWYEDGDPARPMTVTFDRNGPFLLTFQYRTSPHSGRNAADMRIGPDGRLDAHELGVIGADGVWRDAADPGRTATRQPTKK